MAILQASDESFDCLIEKGVFIVDFYTTHCGPCRALLPTLLETEGRLGFVNLIKVNLDDCPGLSDRFMIEATPTIFVGKDGSWQEYYDSFENGGKLQKTLADLYYERSEVDPKAAMNLERLTAEALQKKKPDRSGMTVHIRFNEDAETVRLVQEGLKRKNGYCPCRTQMTPENKCMCREFRDQIADEGFEGLCHCKLYYKEYIRKEA